MKMIGLFRELINSANLSIVGIRDLVGHSSVEAVPLLVEYLKNGVTVLDVMSSEFDPLDKSVVIPGAPSLVSDGYWVWRHDLAYYVDRYNIGLDSDFTKMVIGIGNKKISGAKVLAQYSSIVQCYEAACKKLM